MQPLETAAALGRWLSVIAASVGLFAVGTFVSSRMMVEEISALPVQKTELRRPSYLSPLPEITARGLDAGSIVASAVDVEAEPVKPAAAQEVAVSTVEPAAAPEPEMFVVTANGLNVRAGPSSSEAPLFVLREGEEIRIAETDGNWALVRSASGQSGWAYSKYLAPANRE